jgi:hypothetical protein
MSQHAVIDWLDNPIPGEQPGDIDQSEVWWVERQEALERAGYLLRSRYRPGWKPSWSGTNKFYLDFEDGLPIKVSTNISFPLTGCSYESRCV